MHFNTYFEEHMLEIGVFKIFPPDLRLFVGGSCVSVYISQQKALVFQSTFLSLLWNVSIALDLLGDRHANVQLLILAMILLVPFMHQMKYNDFYMNFFTGKKRCLNLELWHACAGPLVSLPAVGSRVVYFPQGHCEQVRSWLTSGLIISRFMESSSLSNHVL